MRCSPLHRVVPLLLLVACATGCEETSPRTRPPNLVIVLLDTLRADVATATEHGGTGDMPFLASLARRGTLFTQATAPAPWTAPSVASILTGLLPPHHGVVSALRTPRLAEAIETGAEALRDRHGYQTAAFTAGPWFAPQESLVQGFSDGMAGFALEGVEAMVGPWARRRDRSRPSCLLLHTFDAHDPYGEEDHPFPERPIQPVSRGQPVAAAPHEVGRDWLLDRSRRNTLLERSGRAALLAAMQYWSQGYAQEPRPEVARELRDAYVEGVRWVDRQLERAVGRLTALGLLDDTILVVAGDHGEAFGEHGTLRHGAQLHDELVRVPLVVVGPGVLGRGRVVREAVGLVDVMPTLFDAAGLPPLGAVDGRSVLPLVRGEGTSLPLASFEHAGMDNTGFDLDLDLFSLRTERWKSILTVNRRTGFVREELYDLAADPGEARNLVRDGALPEGVDPAFADAHASLRAEAHRGVLTARASDQAAAEAREPAELPGEVPGANPR